MFAVVQMLISTAALSTYRLVSCDIGGIELGDGETFDIGQHWELRNQFLQESHVCNSLQN